MTNPALEWLAARLGRGPATPREVKDDALAAGITYTELLEAKAQLKVESIERIPDAGGKLYIVWALPAEVQLVRADEAPDPPPSDPPKPSKIDPKAAIQKAKDRLARKSVRYVRGIEELSERIDRDATKCPTCGRGTKRSEEIRLRALTAALDRAGVVAPRAGDLGELPERGALIVFPPGTRMAVMVEPEADVAPPATLRRADG